MTYPLPTYILPHTLTYPHPDLPPLPTFPLPYPTPPRPSLYLTYPFPILTYPLPLYPILPLPPPLPWLHILVLVLAWLSMSSCPSTHPLTPPSPIFSSPLFCHLPLDLPSLVLPPFLLLYCVVLCCGVL